MSTSELYDDYRRLRRLGWIPGAARTGAAIYRMAKEEGVTYEWRDGSLTTFEPDGTPNDSYPNLGCVTESERAGYECDLLAGTIAEVRGWFEDIKS